MDFIKITSRLEDKTINGSMSHVFMDGKREQRTISSMNSTIRLS